MNETFSLIGFISFFLSLAWLAIYFGSRKPASAESKLVEEVNSLLPQIQCGQCSYPGCKPYARAIVEKNEAINKCPPGGKETMLKLAEFLGKDPDSSPKKHLPHLVRIREDECIGCLKCIQVCPVDAIIGAPKMIHSVIADACTGCDLCIPACPVDCIETYQLDEGLQLHHITRRISAQNRL